MNWPLALVLPAAIACGALQGTATPSNAPEPSPSPLPSIASPVRSPVSTGGVSGVTSEAGDYVMGERADVFADTWSFWLAHCTARPVRWEDVLVMCDPVQTEITTSQDTWLRYRLGDLYP